MKTLEYFDIDSLVGDSQFIKELKKISLVLCKNKASVLLKGEKGTGKSHFAYLVHLQGKNSPEDFFELNCRIYSETEAISFFNLVSKLPSLDFLGKTIYISNVDALSFELQEKLVLLIKKIREDKKNIRFIFSTEVDIEEKIENNLFSKDLYFQISTVPVNMIPLRQRKEDIFPIAMYYYGKIKTRSGIPFLGFSDAVKEDMTNYFWSGNVAELKNAIERAFIVGEPPYIKTVDMALGIKDKDDESVVEVLQSQNKDKTLKNAVNAFKKSYVQKILEENNWNQTKTAKVLGIQRTYVIRLINELHIRK